MQGKHLLCVALCAMLFTVIFPTTATVSTAAQSTQSIQSTSDAQIWNLKDASIRAVIQTVSALTGKTFIIDPRVHGTITLVSQKPMTPDELYHVFLSMLHLLNYAAVPSGNVIKIIPEMSANALSRQIATATQPGFGDQIVVRVVSVNHVSAAALVPILRPLMTQSGTVNAYFPSNSLILAGTASNIARLVRIIKKMDSVNNSQISVIRCRYANAKKLVDVIHALQTGGGMQGGMTTIAIAADEENNSILIRANLTNQLMMRHLIHTLDQPGRGGDNTSVITLNYLSAKKLAPVLSKIANGMAVSNASSKTSASAKIAPIVNVDGASDISIQAVDSDNAIIMHGPRTMLKSLRYVIQRLDVRPQEVLVQAIIVKIDEGLLNQLGIVWGTSNGQSTPGGDSFTLASPDAAALKVNHGVGFLPDGNLVALLHALKSNGLTDILATPSIVVLNNQQAKIADGQNLGVANSSYPAAPSPASSTNIAPYTTFVRQDVTLSLDVKPHISPNHMINMALIQEDDTVASGADTDNPILNTSKINTSVLVKSGSILVLGGLINNDQEVTVQKLPVLGDIPVIGHLFRYDTHKIQKTNLMVFIRPIIMSRHAAHFQTQKSYAYIRGQQMDMITNKPVTIDVPPVLPGLPVHPIVLPKPQ